MNTLRFKFQGVMQNVDPFGNKGDYRYEATNMIKLLAQRPSYTADIFDLCEDSFQIYFDHSSVWKRLTSEITNILEHTKIQNKVKAELIATAQLKMIKHELMMKVSTQSKLKNE
jgi:hypothetical protein